MVRASLYLPASIAAGIDAHLAYAAIAWLCWVPNLVVAELVINTKLTPSPALPQEGGRIRDPLPGPPPGRGEQS